MGDFYNGAKLLSLTDLDGEIPEIYLCVGNRTAGKTFFYKRMLVRRFLKQGKKFGVLVRFNYEMDGIAESFFKDIKEVSFPDRDMTSVTVGKGLYNELYLDGEHCGYCISLNSADTIKKYSSRFVDIDALFFDEFQSEVGKYCPDEITKFQSVHISVARGGGKHVRYVPVYMCSNTVSVINPYYTVLDITKRLTPDTKFLRGNGWVLEQTFNVNASTAIAESGFGKAFKDTVYMKYSGNNSYLLDNENMIEKLKLKGRMMFIMVDGEDKYGVWNIVSEGLIYVTTKYDPKWRTIISFRTKDHDANRVLLRTTNSIMKVMKTAYEGAQVRFENQNCKNSFLDMVGLSQL